VDGLDPRLRSRRGHHGRGQRGRRAAHRLVLLALGTIPVVFALLGRGGAAVRGVVPLHLGSFLAQAGLMTTLIALIPG
jgi:hypothetical protein